MTQRFRHALMSAILIMALITPSVAQATGPNGQMVSRRSTVQPSAMPAAPGPSSPTAVAAPRPGYLAAWPQWTGAQATAPSQQTAAASPAGRLLLPPTIDADGDPLTNPVGSVPVMRIGGDRPGSEVLYAEVSLAAEVAPDDPAANPAGIEVTFHVWQDSSPISRTLTSRSDAWGAAAVHQTFDDLDLAGRYFYRTSAPGYGQTPVRSFTFDTTRYRSEVRLGAARLTAHVDEGGGLIVEADSDVLVDQGDSAIELVAARLAPTSTVPSAPQHVFLPPLPVPRLDDHRGRARFYLEPGDYALAVVVHSGDVEAQSAPAAVHVAETTAPPIAELIDVMDPSPDGRVVLAQYRTPDGDMALMRRAVADLVDARRTAEPSTFTERRRIGAFQWEVDTYHIKTEVVAGEGKKTARLDGFRYDPIARSYDIAIQSLMDQPVDDTVTMQVFGPGGVVIYEQTTPIRLDPAEPLHYSVTVPSDLGEPQGLRIIVHDPELVDWIIEKGKEILTGIFDALVGDKNPEEGFSLTASNSASFSVVTVNVLTVQGFCSVGGGCSFPPLGGVLGDYLMGSNTDWLDVVTTAIRDFLRGRGFNSIEAAVEAVEEGIPLGTFSYLWTVGEQYAVTLLNPQKCPDPKARDAASNAAEKIGRKLEEIAADLNKRFKGLFDDLTAEAPDPVAWAPPLSFLSNQISPVARPSFAAGRSGDYSVYASFQAQFGLEASVLLKAPSFLAYLRAMRFWGNVLYKAWDISERFVEVNTLFNAIREARNLREAMKNCEPPVPNGHPDDRRDATQAVFSPDPTGASGNLQYYQDQVATAHQLGLSRAETYWTLKERRAELNQLTLDTTSAISNTLEQEAILTETTLRMQALIDGDILPPPGQTITDAVASTYSNFTERVTQTARSRALRERREALDFAERQYQALHGQELALQHELRAMQSQGGIGVLDGGLVTWALGAIGSFGVQAQPVQILAGVSTSQLANSRYFSPYEAPPVLVVPSGGLYRYTASEEARQWLQAYVAGGGTLVVLAQADSLDWGMLPGGQVEGLGYKQDILCKTASVRIVNTSPWIKGLGRDKPDIQVDGSFTAWPPNATVVLMRNTGNKQPAMIEYDYGNGHVVATSAYPDYYMNGLQSTDDIIFARSLFAVAYLTASNEPLAASVPTTGAPLSFTMNVVNPFSVRLSSASLFKDFYGDRIAESWRWGIHQPAALRAAKTVLFTPSLPGGAQQTVTFNFTAPTVAGVFRTGARFCTPGSVWIAPVCAAGPNGGPFYEVRSSFVPPPGFSLQADQEDYAFGETATIVASVTNNKAVARTIRLQPSAGLPATPVTLALGPNGSAQYTWTPRVYGRTAVRVGLYENNVLLSEMPLTLRLRRPELGLTVSAPEVGAGLAATEVATATVGGAHASVLNWQVLLNGAPIASTSTPLSSQGAYSITVASLALPAAAAGSHFTLRTQVPSSTASIAQVVNVVAPAALVGMWVSGPLTIGAANPAAVLALVEDPGVAGTAEARALLVRDGDNAVLDTGPATAVTLGSGLQNVQIALPLTSTLDLNESYHVVAEVTGRTGGAGTPAVSRRATALHLSAPTAVALQSSRRAGQMLDLRVSPAASSLGLPPDGQVEATLTAASFPFSQTLTLSPVGTAGAAVLFQLPVPNLPRGDTFQVELRSAHLANWTGSASFYLPPLQIDFRASDAAVAGGSVDWSAANSGGVDSTLHGALKLTDPDGLVVAQTPVSTTLSAGAAVTVTLAVPDQLRSGRYLLHWQGVDHLGQPQAFTHPVDVAGLELALDGRTDQPGYRADQLASATARIVANRPLHDARLRLQVVRHDHGPGIPEAILRTDWITVTGGVSGTSVLSYTVPFTNPNLMDDGRARGELVLEGTLFSREPAAAPGRQVLASSSYPFVVDNAADGLDFASDRRLYHANVPNYAPDDAASAVALGGVVRNKTTDVADIDVTVVRSDGATIFSQTLVGVPVNQTRTFSAVDPAPPAGAVAYTATTSLGDTEVVTITVQPATVETSVSASPLSIAQYENATVQVTVTNTGSLPAFVSPYLDGDFRNLRLEPGQTIALTETRELEYPGIGIYFEGDLQGMVATSVEVRHEWAYGWAGVTHPLGGRPEENAGSENGVPMPKGEDSGVVLKLYNQPYVYSVVVDYVISGTQTISGTQLVTLHPGENDLIIPMSDAPLGSYHAAFVAYHARLGRLLTEAAVDFELVPPVTDLVLDVSATMLDDNEAARIDANTYGTQVDFPWSGTLRFSGAVEAEHDLTLYGWNSQAFSATLSLEDLSGPQPVTVALVNPDGSVAVSRTLVIQAAPSNAPGATLGGVGVTPGGAQPAQVGKEDASATATLTIAAQVNNSGPAGDAVLEVLAFDEVYEVVGQAAGAAGLHGPTAGTVLSQTVPVPPGLLAGDYPIEVSLGGQKVKVDAQIDGPQLDLHQWLDAAAYEPFGQATWTVELHGVSGQAAPYDVELRYGSQAYTQTVTLGAGDVAQVPWTFEVGPVGERGSVLVESHPLDEEQTRHTLIVDSQWVPVKEDPQAWLESDAGRYNAGDTVHLTYRLLRPTTSAMVMRPDDGSDDATVLWSTSTVTPNVTLTRTVTITDPVAGPVPYTIVLTDTGRFQGDFPIAYQLPAALPSGRYQFTYIFDGEERTLPIDVFGVDLQVEDMTVTAGGGEREAGSGKRKSIEMIEAGAALSVAARLRLKAPLASARIAAFALGPDGEYLSLGSSAVMTTSLPAGVTPIALGGILHALQPGPHQVVLQVRDAGTGALLGGDAASVDVGRASISSLTTDQGTYAPGEPGTGELDVFGFGPTQIVVTATDGSTVFDTLATLDGFQNYSFTIPTATEGDYLLVAQTTDATGAQDHALRAYAVPPPPDTEEPTLTLTSPSTNTILYSSAPTVTLTVQGQVSDNQGPVQVFVNGQEASSAAESQFSAPVVLDQGANQVSVTALDAAGNFAVAPLITVIVTPKGYVRHRADRPAAAVGENLAFRTTLTSTGVLDDVVLLGFVPGTRVSGVTAAASGGAVGSVTQDSAGFHVNWQGNVSPGSPVSIVMTATLSATGVVTSTASASWGWGLTDQKEAQASAVPPLAVFVSSFSVSQEGNQARLAWETVSEIDHLGFDVYRGPSQDGPWSRVNDALIPSPSPGSTAGHVYELLDPLALPPGVTWYRLVAVNIHNVAAAVGLVSIEQRVLDRRLWFPAVSQNGP